MDIRGKANELAKEEYSMSAGGRLAGKVIIFTGATDGIGNLAAKKLANAGAKLYLVGRDKNKAFRVRDEIIQSSGNYNIHVLSGLI